MTKRIMNIIKEFLGIIRLVPLIVGQLISMNQVFASGPHCPDDNRITKNGFFQFILTHDPVAGSNSRSPVISDAFIVKNEQCFFASAQAYAALKSCELQFHSCKIDSFIRLDRLRD